MEIGNPYSSAKRPAEQTYSRLVVRSTDSQARVIYTWLKPGENERGQVNGLRVGNRYPKLDFIYEP